MFSCYFHAVQNDDLTVSDFYKLKHFLAATHVPQHKSQM